MIDSSRSRSSPSGSDSARATETPPRKPPQVSTRTVPLGTGRQRRSSTIAGATVNSRDSSTANASTLPAARCIQLNGSSRSSRPISANSKALSMSSINSQKPSM
ncbi:hypothetical protein D3C80_1945740 [compost metagenome]